MIRDTLQHRLDATQALGGVLDSPETEALWVRHHYSRRDDNPAPVIAEQIRSLYGDLRQDPALLSFMKELAKIERKALGPTRDKDDADKKSLRAGLEGLEAYLESLSEGVKLPPPETLPEDHQKILHMYKHKTGQIPIEPLRATGRTLKNAGAHIWEDVKEHPKSALGLLIFATGTLAFMKKQIGSSATTYINPQATALTNFSMDALDDPDYVPEFDQAYFNPNIELTCHDHITQLFGETAADIAQNSLNIAGLFPQHCSRVKTLALDAHDKLNAGYDFVNTRIGFIIKDPALDLGEKLIPDSPFKLAFMEAAHNTAEGIYAFNTVENVVLHTIIFGSAMAGTIKLGAMDSGEGKEALRDIRDFFHRTSLNTPLSYIFGGAATAHSYLADGMNPEMVWMGLGGALAGQVIHKGMRTLSSHKHVEKATLSVQKNLARFAKPDKVLSGNMAGETSAPVSENFWMKPWRKIAKGLGLTGAFAAADIVATGGEITGAALGATSVILPFLFYNVPEDLALHVIFGAAGAAAGGAVLAGRKIKNSNLMQQLSRKLGFRKNSPVPPSPPIEKSPTQEVRL